MDIVFNVLPHIPLTKCAKKTALQLYNLKQPFIPINSLLKALNNSQEIAMAALTPGMRSLKNNNKKRRIR